MTVMVVTAFVPIPGHPRSVTEYAQLGNKLLNINHTVMCSKGDLEHCWLHTYLMDEYGFDTTKFSHSVADNPKKNSLAYHIVQAQKTEWVAMASIADPVSDVFVWIDFGIFHVPGVTQPIIDAFLDRAETERAIAIPGCWRKNERPYDDLHPYWRFCGGVMIVPRKFARDFNLAMKGEYARWLAKTGNISWEVNTLARLEQEDPVFPVWWYAANHDSTLFRNYRGTQNADTMSFPAPAGIAGYTA
jgi:hypothetical protein